VWRCPDVNDKNTPQADAELLSRYRGGEAQAFDLLVERHQAPLLRFASGILRDSSRAEDVVQEVFLRLLRMGPELGSGASAGPWLFRVCRNLAYDTMKMETRENARRDKIAVPEQSEPSSDCEHQEVLTLVQREMLQLPEREREALWLKVHDGLTYAEIGEVLGVKAGTVGWLVHEGMNRLTARLRMAQAI
jgi:RNA polymerase sigma factor (sigma-70 family)